MSVSAKLAAIREVMAKAGADMHVVNVLETSLLTLNPLPATCTVPQWVMTTCYRRETRSGS